MSLAVQLDAERFCDRNYRHDKLSLRRCRHCSQLVCELLESDYMLKYGSSAIV
jgi:hypothetical protein